MIQNSTNQSPIGKFAKCSIICTAIFMALLFVLHFIKPEIDPSWRFISEYALGDHGWLMNAAFIALGISFSSLYVAIKTFVWQTIAGKVGAVLLLVSAAGLVLAGTFNTDPITASDHERTVGGTIHAFGGTLGIAMPFAVIMIYFGLRKNEAWLNRIKYILLATAVSTIGFLFSFISLAAILSQSNGKFGPDVMIGWPNRIEIICYCIWLLVAASEVLLMRANLEAEQTATTTR